MIPYALSGSSKLVERLDVTLYSFRKETAMDYEAAFGADVARELLGHDADTRTLEAHYIQRAPVRDVSVIGLHEDPSDQALTRASERMALEVLTPEVLAKTQGPALNALYRQMVNSDPNYPHHESLEKQKLYDRRIRRVWTCIPVLK